MEKLKYCNFSLIIYTYIFFSVTCMSVPLQKKQNEPFVVPCPTVDFFRDSTYTKLCFQDPYSIYCIALLDLGVKWCSKISQNINLPHIANATQFDQFVSKFESVTELMKFCSTPKSVTIKENETSLKVFYNDASMCIPLCLDPETENKKPKKLCSALTWLEATMNSAGKKREEKITKLKAVNTESKIEENIPIKVADPAVNSNTKTETKKDEKKTPSVEIKTTPKVVVNENPPESPKINNKPIAKQKEKMPKNKEVAEDPSNLKTEKKIDPDEKKIDKTPDQNGGLKKDEVPNVNENPVVVNQEKVEKRPNVNRKPETDGNKTDKTEVNGKTEKVQNNEDIKSSTISENTNNVEPISDDAEIPRPIDVDGQRDENLDTGIQDPGMDFDREKKPIPHYPGKSVEEESHIFSYFVAFSLLFVCCYIGYLSKKKILAILLEGRRSRNGRGRRRPSTANYRKLDCNLEEAVTSQCNSNVTNVIY